jgi:hypothetical protein
MTNKQLTSEQIEAIRAWFENCNCEICSKVHALLAHISAQDARIAELEAHNEDY